MPMSDFRSIFDNIDKVIPLTEEDGFVISSQPCSSIQSLLAPITFLVGEIALQILPKGYIRSNSDGKKCEFLLKGLSDSEQKFTLGEAFVRNFVTGLDFEGKTISFEEVPGLSKIYDSETFVQEFRASQSQEIFTTEEIVIP